MAAALAVTRSKSYIHVIGNPLEQFDGRLLLTCREVLQVYFFCHKMEKLSKKDAVSTVIRDVCVIWARARVPTAEERSIILKLNKLLERYRDISRNKGRQSAAQLSRETDFESTINQLIDIAHCQAMELIVIEETHCS